MSDQRGLLNPENGLRKEAMRDTGQRKYVSSDDVSLTSRSFREETQASLSQRFGYALFESWLILIHTG